MPLGLTQPVQRVARCDDAGAKESRTEPGPTTWSRVLPSDASGPLRQIQRVTTPDVQAELFHQHTGVKTVLTDQTSAPHAAPDPDTTPVPDTTPLRQTSLSLAVQRVEHTQPSQPHIVTAPDARPFGQSRHRDFQVDSLHPGERGQHTITEVARPIARVVPQVQRRIKPNASAAPQHGGDAPPAPHATDTHEAVRRLPLAQMFSSVPPAENVPRDDSTSEGPATPLAVQRVSDEQPGMAAMAPVVSRAPATETGSIAPPLEQAAAATEASTAGGAGIDIDELARQLFGPLSARLRSELWLDRERAGMSIELRR
ncbi:MAG: hypothetical protein WBG89_08070 [Ornithinimicrobium sp.]